jgi:hypothetical protein
MDSPCSIAARDRGTVFHDAPLQVDEDRDPAAPYPPDPGPEGVDGPIAGQPEHHTYATSNRSPLVELDLPDHGPLDSEQAAPSALAFRTPFSALGFLFLNSSET